MVCCHKIMKKRNGKKKGIQYPYEKILPPEPSHEEFIRMQLNLGFFFLGTFLSVSSFFLDGSIHCVTRSCNSNKRMFVGW